MPTLVIHGDSDGTVPFEVSGKRTAETVAGAQLVVVEDGPHGLNVSHAERVQPGAARLPRLRTSTYPPLQRGVTDA